MRISDWSSDVCSSDLDAPDIRLFVEAGNEDRDLGPIIVDAMSHAVIRSWLRIADTVFSIPSARLRAAFQPISDCARSGAARSSDGVRPGRSEARRGGKAGVSTCRSRWSPVH